MSQKSLDNEITKVLAEALDESDDKFREVAKQFDLSGDKIQGILNRLYAEAESDDEDDGLDYSKAIGSRHYRDLEKAIDEEADKISAAELATTAAILAAVYKNTYYKSTFALEQEIGIDLNFDLIPEEAIRIVVNKDWSGEHFSQRIWNNQNKLKKELKDNLTYAIKNGESLPKVASKFQKSFDTKKYQAERLVRTETAKIADEANEKVYKDQGVEQVRWVATLEANTCEVCADLDSNVYDINNHPPIPVHPNCRCVLSPYIEGLSSDIRKDNESKEYVNVKNYDEWFEKRVGG